MVLRAAAVPPAPSEGGKSMQRRRYVLVHEGLLQDGDLGQRGGRILLIRIGGEYQDLPQNVENRLVCLICILGSLQSRLHSMQNA